MSTTLQTYLTATQRLLHDSSNNYWSVSELTDYINEGRNDTVSKTGCNRVLQLLTVNPSQEVYTFSSFATPNTIDILNFTVIWGSSRIPLQYMSFTEINARLRTWTNMTSRPIAFAVYGQSSVYVEPPADQTYSCELDTVVLPNALVNTTDVETLNYPWTDPVPYYAAHKAKFKEQSYKEAEVFLQEYKKRIISAIGASGMRRIPNVYG